MTSRAGSDKSRAGSEGLRERVDQIADQDQVLLSEDGRLRMEDGRPQKGARPLHEPDLGAPASSRRVSKREKPTPTRRQDAGAPGFMVPMHSKKRKAALHEPCSSRREEAHSNLGEGSQSLLTSAATVQGLIYANAFGKFSKAILRRVDRSRKRDYVPFALFRGNWRNSRIICSASRRFRRLVRSAKPEDYLDPGLNPFPAKEPAGRAGTPSPRCPSPRAPGFCLSPSGSHSHSGRARRTE